MEVEVVLSPYQPRQDGELPQGEHLGNDLVHGEAGAIIRHAVRRILRGTSASESDHDDVAQDLCLAVLARLAKYDSRRGRWPAFATIVIRSREGQLRRRYLRGRHLERTVGELDCIDRSPEAAITQSDLRHDFKAVVSRLPHKLQYLCELLTKRTVAAAARELGIPRTTLRRRIAKLREHFDR
jgi:RNA polymerase sigma factor (sigma-70 family)